MLGYHQIYAYINAAQSLLQLKTPANVETAACLLAQAIQHSQDLRDKGLSDTALVWQKSAPSPLN